MPPPATARGARSAASSTPLGAAGGGRRGPLPDPLAHPLPTPLPTSPATPSAPTSGLLHPLAPARRPRAASGAPDRVVHALLLLLLEPAGPKPFAPTATRSVRSHFAALPFGSSLPTSPAVADALSPDTFYFPVVQKTVSDRNAHVWAVRVMCRIVGIMVYLAILPANVCLNKLNWWMEGKMHEYFWPGMIRLGRRSFPNIRIFGDQGCPPGLSLSHEVGRSKTSKMDYLRCGGSHALIGIRGPREDTVELELFACTAWRWQTTGYQMLPAEDDQSWSTFCFKNFTVTVSYGQLAFSSGFFSLVYWDHDGDDILQGNHITVGQRRKKETGRKVRGIDIDQEEDSLFLLCCLM
uniref:Uncharacterized protein n=1 Tax=Oryza rufipogon TaxID=4529 RepID=A0A0E0PYV6_ORYRU